jgi:hypothetical protein
MTMCSVMVSHLLLSDDNEGGNVSGGRTCATDDPLGFYSSALAIAIHSWHELLALREKFFVDAKKCLDVEIQHDIESRGG